MNKERSILFLISLGLGVLLLIASYYVFQYRSSTCPRPSEAEGAISELCLDTTANKYGLPLRYFERQSTPTYNKLSENVIWKNLILDFVFWDAATYAVLNLVNQRRRKA
jgi:hypothetical protein